MVIKCPHPAPVFSSHPEYHKEKEPNPASRQTYCGPSPRDWQNIFAMFIHPYPSQINCRCKFSCFFFVTLLRVRRTLPTWKLVKLTPPPFPWENPIPSVGVAWIFPGTSDRPLNFAWKIVLPETLASEKLIEMITKWGLLWVIIIFLPRWGAPSILSCHGHFARLENWKFGIFCGAVKCLICIICQGILYLFIGKHL